MKSHTESRRLVVGNSWLYNGHQYTDGSTVCINTRRSHFSSKTVGLNNIQLGYSNFSVNGNSPPIVETATPNPMYVTAYIEYPAGVFTPTSIGGSTIVGIAGGRKALFDPAFVYISQNTQWWTHSMQWVNPPLSSQTIPMGDPCFSFMGESATYSSTVTDLHGSMTPNSNNGLGPTAILSNVPGIRKAYGIISDSIGYIGDAFDLIHGNLGSYARAIDNKYGYVALQTGGDSATQWAAALNSTCRLETSFNGLTDMIVALGANDVVLPTPPSSLQTYISNMQTIITAICSLGIRVHLVTLDPYTTSTDNYVTTTYQTVGPNEALRVQANNFLRTCPFGAASVIDTASMLETSFNSGIRIINGAAAPNGYCTTNGVHRSPLAHALIDRNINGYL